MVAYAPAGVLKIVETKDKIKVALKELKELAEQIVISEGEKNPLKKVC